MKKNNLYTTKRYLLIFVLACFLIGIGSVLTKVWRLTPETHFVEAINLLSENKKKEALVHFLLANKSHDITIRSTSAYYLGKLYQKGAKGISKNIRKAVFYYEQASRLNVSKAQYELALLYDVGDKIPENRDKAIKLMIEAARMLPEAKYALAVWIERGYLGKPDQAWAVALYEQAANAGITNAMKSLVSIYHEGFGKFPENVQREQYWHNRLKSEKK